MEKEELTWIMEIPKQPNRFVYSVLYKEFNETTVGELAKFIKYRRTTCGDTLRRLQTLGWVELRLEHRTKRGRPLVFWRALTPNERKVAMLKDKNHPGASKN